MSVLNRTPSLFCLLFTRFVFGVIENDPPCSCVGIAKGCSFTNRFLPSDGSKNKENIALGKPAFLSSTYQSPTPGYGTALNSQGCLVVNGYRTSVYVAYYLDPREASCIHSNFYDYNPTWTLDLGRKYTITDIVVYLRKDYEDRFHNTTITVDGQLCFTNSKKDVPTVFSLKCTLPLTGQTIVLTRSARPDYYMNMCEFEVWVCIPGFYGSDCNTTCDKCRHGCDNYHGTCLTPECFHGFYGEKCDQICGNCIKNVCNNIGKCTLGCKLGWHGEKCDRGEIQCPDGFYGTNCSINCGYCIGNTCDEDTGNCQFGCQANWSGINCDVQNKSEEFVFSNEKETSTLKYFVGVIIGSIGLIAVICVILIHRKRQQEDVPSSSHDLHYNRSSDIKIIEVPLPPPMTDADRAVWLEKQARSHASLQGKVKRTGKRKKVMFKGEDSQRGDKEGGEEPQEESESYSKMDRNLEEEDESSS